MRQRHILVTKSGITVVVSIEETPTIIGVSITSSVSLDEISDQDFDEFNEFWLNLMRPYTGDKRMLSVAMNGMVYRDNGDDYIKVIHVS